MEGLLSAIEAFLNEGKQKAILFFRISEKATDVAFGAQFGARKMDWFLILGRGKMHVRLLCRPPACFHLSFTCGLARRHEGADYTASSSGTPQIFDLKDCSDRFQSAFLAS
jgi:hypothetical protein